MKQIAAIRGATCTKNNEADIMNDVVQMCNEIFIKNRLCAGDLVSIQFSVTKDITKMNPATALRKGGCCIDITRTALFCALEPEMENSMPLTIRVMVTAYKRRRLEKVNVYLNGAGALRPDYKS